MKYNFKRIAKWVVVGLFMVFCVSVLNSMSVLAAGYGLTMAPMKQSVVIDPGSSFKDSFRISNPSSSTQDTYYNIEIEPFYRDEDGAVTYTAEGDYSEIMNWVTLDVPASGKLAPNEIKDVIVTIDVPKTASASGQYFSVNVTAAAKPIDSEDDSDELPEGATIKEVKRMSHLVYAEITGNTVKRGEIIDANVPSFLLSGEITGSASIKNLGNVHGEARYTMEIYPLFSDEALYTNVENPSTSIILPDRTVYNAISWDKTPSIGIFNVVYKVEFEESVAEISKVVIICPVWLLFIIFFAIAMVIIWLVMKAKSRR